MEKTAQPRPFGLRDKIGYLFGDFGNDFTFILSTVILSKFYTDVMGVSAGVVGTVMMLARAVDAVTDLSMGRLCDRSRPTPVGKFKPWLLRLCVPVAAASFLLYQSGLGWINPEESKPRFDQAVYFDKGTFDNSFQCTQCIWSERHATGRHRSRPIPRWNAWPR